MRSANCSESETIILYHGSTATVPNPAIIAPSRPMDYGAGFYCTTSRRQAANRAAAKSVNREYGVVNIYSVKQSDLNGLDILRFETADETWVDFVEKNRRDKNFHHKYDIVIGPVADDRVNRSFSLYESRIITKRELISRLKTYKLTNQYLFHTERSLAVLAFIRSEKVSKPNKMDTPDDNINQFKPRLR